ncbi:hypothetical protein [Vibrio sp. SS-MA-C1-2]|nr:hypothetical protein [Vibrio sp. SS-MA-C1-2]
MKNIFRKLQGLFGPTLAQKKRNALLNKMQFAMTQQQEEFYE